MEKDALADEAGSSLIDMAGGLCEFVDSPWRVMFASATQIRAMPRYACINRARRFVLFRICCYGKLSLPPGVISRVHGGGEPVRNDWLARIAPSGRVCARLEAAAVDAARLAWTAVVSAEGGPVYTQPPLLLCCSHVKRAIASCIVAARRRIDTRCSVLRR